MKARELKARKAKFGFDAGGIFLTYIIPHARLLEGLEQNWPAKYTAEATGYGSNPDLKIDTEAETFTYIVHLVQEDEAMLIIKREEFKMNNSYTYLDAF